MAPDGELTWQRPSGRSAGRELWLDDDDYPLRAAGHAICGATIDLGGLRVELAFMRFTAEGRTGLGRYEIVRKV